MSEHSHAAVHSEAHHVSLATYIAVFVALMVLLVATIAVTYIDVGRWNIIIALSIAVAKAALIVTYFMHIRYADGVTRLYSLVGFLWFGLLILISMSDYLTRGLDQSVVHPTSIRMPERLTDRLPGAPALAAPKADAHAEH